MPVNLQDVRRVFEKSQERSERLLELHRLLHGKKGRPSRIVSDVVRGSLVLSAASLDSLLNSALVASAPEALRQGKLGPVASSWASKHDGLVDALLHPDPPAFVGSVVKEKLANFTLQAPEAIESNLDGVITCPPPWPRAADILRPTAVRPQLLTGEMVKEGLAAAINRRNRIAHDADINPAAKIPGTAKPIRKEDVETWLWIIGGVGQASLDVIEEHLHD